MSPRILLCASDEVKEGQARGVLVSDGGKRHDVILLRREDALFAYDIPLIENYICINELGMEAGRENAAYLWNLENPPEAIFCQSDYSALGAMQYLKEKGIQIPEDVLLIGFANEPFTAFIEPALTTVDQHPIEMGQTVAKLFLEQMESDPKSFLPKNITLNAELVVRSSSLRVN